MVNRRGDFAGTTTRMSTESSDPQEIIAPLYEGQASLAKRSVVTGTVQVSTATLERERWTDEVLGRRDVEIGRTPVGKWIVVALVIREEGATTVVPIVEGSSSSNASGYSRRSKEKRDLDRSRRY
jgi:hypothetical protein